MHTHARARAHTHTHTRELDREWPRRRVAPQTRAGPRLADRQNGADDGQRVPDNRHRLAVERRRLAVERRRLAVERRRLAVERRRLAVERRRLAVERRRLARDLPARPEQKRPGGSPRGTSGGRPGHDRLRRTADAPRISWPRPRTRNKGAFCRGRREQRPALPLQSDPRRRGTAAQ